MSGEKNGSYKGLTEARRRANKKYNDRFVIPSDVNVSREGRLEMQHNRGFACPTGGCHNG